ncbi:MAG TPA: histidine phosphatase family protein [Solirubrobacteraceae bacterium]|nr:histidine phosphatase family protein [Solirubrobacteraceae bacterium]
MRRLLLVRHAPTAATRAARFPVDEPLDERGHAAAAALGARLPGSFEALTSPALRCRQTAEAAGLSAPSVEPGLAECDFGAWAGRSLADVHEAEPETAEAWMLDPQARPHGGESLATFAARVSAWLDSQAQLDGRAVAVTHAGVVKAAVIHALAGPLDAIWRIDVAPLSVTELHARDGRWTVTRVNCMPDVAGSTGNTRHDRSLAGDGAPS